MPQILSLRTLVICLLVALPCASSSGTTCKEYLTLVASHRGRAGILHATRTELDTIYANHSYGEVPQEDILLLQKYFRVRKAGKFSNLSEQEQSRRIQAVFDALSRVPASVRNTLLNKVHVEVVARNLNEHAKFPEMALEREADEALGIFFPPLVVVTTEANTISVTIHELGHAIDEIQGEGMYLSQGDEFLTAFRKTSDKWEDDYFSWPLEGFAESFRLFYENEISRAHLKQRHPAVYEYFSKRFGLPPSRTPLEGGEKPRFFGTAEVKDRISDSLLSDVEFLENHGGAGRWFLADQMFVETGKKTFYYQITQVPAQPIANSPIFLLRTALGVHSLKEMVQAGAPILLVETATGGVNIGNSVVTAGAFVAPKAFDVTATLQGLTQNPKLNAAIGIPSTAPYNSLKHEYKHWLDFMDDGFMNDLKQDVTSIPGMEPNTVPLVYQMILEIRAHAAEAQSYLDSLQSGNSITDAAGNIIQVKPQDIGLYQSGVLFGLQPYQKPMFDLLDSIKTNNPQGFQRLVEVLKKYDNPDPGSEISFRKMFGPALK